MTLCGLLAAAGGMQGREFELTLVQRIHLALQHVFAAIVVDHAGLGEGLRPGQLCSHEGTRGFRQDLAVRDLLMPPRNPTP